MLVTIQNLDIHVPLKHCKYTLSLDTQRKRIQKPEIHVIRHHVQNSILTVQALQYRC